MGWLNSRWFNWASKLVWSIMHFTHSCVSPNSPLIPSLAHNNVINFGNENDEVDQAQISSLPCKSKIKPCKASFIFLVFRQALQGLMVSITILGRETELASGNRWKLNHYRTIQSALNIHMDLKKWSISGNWWETMFEPLTSHPQRLKFFVMGNSSKGS